MEHSIPVGRKVVGGLLIPPWAVAVLAVAWALGPGADPAASQAMAEYGHATAAAGARSIAAPKLQPATKTLPTAQPATKTRSPHLEARSPEGPEIASRKALEQRAGSDAARLSLSSVPMRASVRIDHKPVGNTPLVLTLAPGAYRIDMVGPQKEFAQQQVTLRPKENREVVLSLQPRYPSHIVLR